MVDFGGSDKMIKKKKWINQTLTMGLVVIFCSLLTEELCQTKHFFCVFLHFSNWRKKKKTQGECKKV